MVILLSSLRNVPIRVIYLLLFPKIKYLCRYAIPFANNTKIYSTIKKISVEEARVIEEARRFPYSFIKVKNALALFKKKRDIKCEKLGGFIAEHNFRFFNEGFFRNKVDDCIGQNLQNGFPGSLNRESLM